MFIIIIQDSSHNDLLILETNQNLRKIFEIQSQHIKIRLKQQDITPDTSR